MAIFACRPRLLCRRAFRSGPYRAAARREPAHCLASLALRPLRGRALPREGGGSRPLARPAGGRGGPTRRRARHRAGLGRPRRAPIGADDAVRGGHIQARRLWSSLPLLLHAGGDPGLSLRAARDPRRRPLPRNLPLADSGRARREGGLGTSARVAGQGRRHARSCAPARSDYPRHATPTCRSYSV